MIQNKFKKILVSLVLVFIMIFALGQNFIYATVQGPKYFISKTQRYVKNGETYTAKKAYKIGLDIPIYQVLSVNTSNVIQGINFYCLDAKLALSQGLDSGNVNTYKYDIGYDMVNDYVPMQNNLPEGYKKFIDKHNMYPQLMWILDHMYIKDSNTVEEILADAGIVYVDNDEDDLHGYYYDSGNNSDWHWGFVGYKYANPSNSSQFIDVLLNEEEVEAVQQAAIWYVTNGSESDFDRYVTPTGSSGDATWFEYTENTYAGSTQAEIRANEAIKMYKQEQAAILYNYLVDGAKEAKRQGYESGNEGTLRITSTGAKMVSEGNNYKIGPMKIEKTGEVSGIKLTAKTGTNFNTTVNSSDMTLSIGSLQELPINNEFYITVPKNKIDGSVKFNLTGKTSSTTKILWVNSTNPNAQPVVEYKRTSRDLPTDLTVSPEQLFDLALRKQIIAVNGGSTLKNEENKDAKRVITADTSTIPDTATYKHRKDPIVVSTGNKVTYRLYIYNEGDIDGYASIIKDTLASGLIKSSDMGETIRSEKGNTYTVTTSGNTITLTLTGTAHSISAHTQGSNTLDYDYVDIICEVTQNPETNGDKHYLTNIAYIAEAKNSAGTTVPQDRISESKPGNVPDLNTQNGGLNVTDKSKVYRGGTGNGSIFNQTNNDDYFAGQEDDDDFETVVVLPKEFDLKLMKNILKVNGNDVGEDVRKITIDIDNLKPNGSNDTTANYQVKKEPIMVKTGDFVTYRLTIYNEGEINGYAEEISEDIPEGLEFVKDDEYGINRLYKWKMYDQNGNETTDETQAKLIKTTYLSRSENAPGNLLHAFDGTNKPNSKYVDIVLKVTATDVTKFYRNEAAISEDADENGNPVKDRDSEPGSTPDKWTKEDVEDLYNNNPDYPKYKEDDEDYDNIRLARFDIALRKFISKVSSDGNFENTATTITYEDEREPDPDTSELNKNGVTTATYNHSKKPIVLNVGDYVLYTIRVYNEGEIDGYAKEITDYLPEDLAFVDFDEESPNYEINSKWTYNPETRQVKSKADAPIAGKKLKAFDGTQFVLNKNCADIQIICKVKDSATSTRKITNFAKITKYADEDENEIEKDIDSRSDDDNLPSDFPKYKDEVINDEYIPGFEDDDDFEKVVVRGPGKYDLILIKEDENGEDLNSKATFEVNGETKEVTGRLIIADDVEINASNVNTPDVYTIKETIPPDDYCTFNGIIKITVNKKIDGNTYTLDGNPVWDVIGENVNKDDAKVHLKDGNIYVEVVDHEQKDFDLALRKFITNISENDVTSRIPEVSYKDGKITYIHSKDVVKVHVDDIVTYTLRVFNEGEIDGYAEQISDDIPEYLEFLPNHKINKEYKWKMLDKDGKETTNVKETVKIITDYTSRANGAEKNLLKAFDPNAEISDTNPAHLDVKVAFRVKDPNSNKYVIVNNAQISEDADGDGNPVDDIDSIPDKWNKGEDDQDYENVSVEYFDLALLKYVTKVYVTENGKTTTRSTGNTGKDTDIIPKVEIHKNKINKTIVKFEYTIKITNEGDVAGYAKEITDYVPKGLKFYAADNTGWKDEGNNVISTKLLENTLLKPGQSATVKVVLRWINGENNLQTKINIAEISEDYNDKDIPDRDSTPDNKKPGEDDIDDAPVLLGIRTGSTENIVLYAGVSLVILAVLGTGIILIKKFVL